MAEKLSFFSQWLGGDWAERSVINTNAEALDSVEKSVRDLREQVARQHQEIQRLQAMVAGLVDVLQTKMQLDDAELESAVNDVWKAMQPQPKATPQSTDPYRGLPVEATAEDIEAAKRLLKMAENHHFSKQFDEARAIYKQIVEQYGSTKQANVARQQLENLR